tara:strand:+ start:467 stop:796 length:330 start_codon:yes stop_codon:yes gene_type:complete
MIIPYFNYEISFSLSNKTYFCIGLVVLFMVLANPPIYKLVGGILGLHEYEDKKSYHKYYLVGIHSIIYGLIIYLILSIYNPFKSIHNTKLIHKSIVPKSIIPKSKLFQK